MIRARILSPQSREDIRYEIDQIGADRAGREIMVNKGQFFLIKVYNVPLKGVILIKQEMLSKGGEAAVAREVGSLTPQRSDLLLMGTFRQFRSLIKKLKFQPFQSREVARELEEALQNYNRHHYLGGSSSRFLKVGDKNFKLGERTLIMGILNVTPDSFSDGGQFFDLDQALEHARSMVEEGIDILDIGGESTRPQAVPLSEEEELERVLPVLDKLVGKVGVPLSIDTYKAFVAEKALEMGVHMVNDVWGFKADPEIAEVAARYHVPVCLMHNRKVAQYDDLMTEITEDLRESLDIALKAGVKEENLILDPGIGFGKNLEHNLETMNHLKELVALGYPLLLGTSRKSMIGKVLDLPAQDRLEGTAATLAYGITQGADIVRVHDIKYMKRVVNMTDAIVRRPHLIDD